MSLDEPELVDSVLTFPCEYDTLEYSWVKATAVSVSLRILFLTLQNTNYIIYGLSRPRIFFIFSDSTFTPATHGATILSIALYPKGRVL